MSDGYDALLVVSFGGPEGPEEVVPFLENVLRGKNVPRERLLEVAEHYEQFGGVSPINDQNRALVAAVEKKFAEQGPSLPVYWGNRNWRPFLAETLHQMATDGITRSLALVTSAFSSYSGCRQYLDDIQRAQKQLGARAPVVHKLRMFHNHPDFIAANVDHVRTAFNPMPEEDRGKALLLFTAHSLPRAMANTCQYEAQLKEACRLVADRLGHSNWQLVYQSRSGPPGQPWLEPDIGEFIEQRHQQGECEDLVLLPIGFVSDHMEVIYDLDTEVRAICDRLGIRMMRAATAGSHPRFIDMIRMLTLERMTSMAERPALGRFGPSHDFCPDDCCPNASRPVS